MVRFCIWQISREYADIAESGGVKNVTASLCEELAKEGHSVYLFIPLYGCTNLSHVSNYTRDCIPPVEFSICNKICEVHFDSAEYKSLKMIFIRHPSFSEKEAVYTYTAHEEEINAKHKKGEGHEDSLFLNTLFQKSVLEFGKSHKEAIPDIIHCQDAMTALVPVFLNCEYKDIYAKSHCIVTIHNAGAGYHHCYKDFDEAKFYTNLPDEVLKHACNNGRIEPILLAADFSTLTTVSPYYAKELLDCNNEKTDGLSAILCERNIEIEGITNAIDYDRYNPENTKVSLLPFSFSPKNKNILGKYKCRDYFLKNMAAEDKYEEIKEITRYGYISLGTASDVSEPVYICYHGRIVRQKGIHILTEAADKILAKNNAVRFIFIGQGESCLEDELKVLSQKYLGKCIYFRGYDRALSRLCIAVSDFIALPSNFEPCGLEDFIAQIFGTIPVAHATGGLQKIVDGQTGFLYEQNTSEALCKKLLEVILRKQEDFSAFYNIISTAASYVHDEYSWSNVVKNSYLPLYRKVLKNNKI